MTWRMESENNVFRAMVIWLISLFLQNNQLRQIIIDSQCFNGFGVLKNYNWDF